MGFHAGDCYQRANCAGADVSAASCPAGHHRRHRIKMGEEVKMGRRARGVMRGTILYEYFEHSLVLVSTVLPRTRYGTVVHQE